MIMLAMRSLLNRRFAVGLTILSIALSTALILGVERLRVEARAGFANSASGLDLIVGPRGNDVQILMATVFGTGTAGPGLQWKTFEMVENLPQVAWAVPLMLGDNHRGYPVTGTRASYFQHVRHSGGTDLRFSDGVPFGNPKEAVVGAEVADAFGYSPGSVIVNAHGSGAVAFDLHDEWPFTISGVLDRTGTAIDRMVFVSLEGFDSLHAGATVAADPFAALGIQPNSGSEDHETDPQYKPNTVDAIYVGLANRSAVLSVQRALSEFRDEPLTGVLPGAALLQLWSITRTAESALQIMAGAVALAGLIGMVVMLSTTLDSRRREFAILRSVGATPMRIFSLILLEAAMVMVISLVLGCLALSLIIAVADPFLAARYGIRIGIGPATWGEVLLLALIFLGGICASLIPARRVYKITVADGLTIHI